jgi:hypothetical protein
MAFEASPARRYKEFYDGAASWSRARRARHRPASGPAQRGPTRASSSLIW